MINRESIMSWINDEASDIILARGLSYRTSVKRLNYIESAQKWTAVVDGTSRYDVEIGNLMNDDYYGKCNCPYDLENVCKHIVAVAYEIADKTDLKVDVKKVSVLNTNVEEKNTPETSSEKFYESVFLKMPTAIQTAFLKQLFYQNESVRRQFLNFATAEMEAVLPPQKKVKTEPKAVKKDSPKTDIAELSAEIYETLTDLEIDGNDYYEDYSYDEYGDDEMETWAEGIVAESVSIYKKEINRYLSVQDIFSALTVLVAVHEAADGLPEDVGAGDYTIFYSFKDTVLSIFQAEYNAILNAIENTVLSAGDIWKMTTQLLDITIPSHFAYFEKILLSLCKEKKISIKVLDYLKEENLLITETAELALHCSQFSDDKAEWITLALKLYGKKDSIAEKILTYYDAQKDVSTYHNIAERVLIHHPTQKLRFVEMMVDKLDYDVAPEFFLATLSYYANATKSIEKYQKLCNFWVVRDKNLFIKSQENSVEYYAKILTYENRMDDLLDYANRRVNDYSLYSLFKYIGQRFPEDSFRLFKAGLSKDEAGMKMDRKGYSYFCIKLKYLKDIAVADTEKQQLISFLQTKYRGRPAFLDELQQVIRSMRL